MLSARDEGFDVETIARLGRRARGTRQGAAAAGTAVVTSLLLAGCESAWENVAADAQPASPAQVAISVARGAEDLRPDHDVSVDVTSGTLRSVTLTDATGTEFSGRHDELSWRLTQSLRPASTYTLVVTAMNADGEERSEERSFSTLTPKVEATYRVLPDGETVGVGMPVQVTFDSEVATPKMRAEVEKRIRVTTVPRTAGSWGWVNSTQLRWRPQSYWKPGTKVMVNAPLAGAQTGADKWVTEDKDATFTIADRARISTVDLDNHTVRVRDDGETVATYPMSAGQATGSWETRSGTKVITEKHSFLVMDAATLGVPVGDPDYYRTDVRYAMRVTDTGEFFHSAPWSVWAQGNRNVSHGCVNLGPRDAKEFFESSVVGDVAEFVGGDRPMKPGDGMSVWLFSWAEWKAASALAAQPKGDAGEPAEPGGESQAAMSVGGPAPAGREITGG